MKRTIHFLFSLLLALPLTCIGQTIFNGETYYPLPFPERNASASKARASVDSPVRLDLDAKMEILPDKPADTEITPAFLPAHDGAIESGKGEPLDLSKTFTDLVLVPFPTDDPFRRMVKLFVKKGSQKWECSGSLIDSRHVLTAAHCIYEMGWADTVFVVPAYYSDGSVACAGVLPFGVSKAVDHMYSWTGYTQYGDLDFDLGFVFLDRPVGALTGWLGVGTDNSLSFYSTNYFVNASYPGDAPFNGGVMYHRVGAFNTYYSYTFPPGEYVSKVYDLNQGYHGESGSPYFVGYSKIAYGVLSNGGEEPPYTDSIIPALIQDFQFLNILATFNQNTPDQTDLIPLWTKTSTDSVPAGGLLDDFSCLVHNYSPAFSGSFEATVRLSTDNHITPLDIPAIPFTATGSIAYKGTEPVELQGSLLTMPAWVAPGNYFIGVTLDIMDADILNNATTIWDVDEIKVLGLTPVPETLNPSPVGELLSFDIQSNTTWTISSNASWLVLGASAGYGNKTVSVLCQYNPAPDAREGIITLHGPLGMVAQVLVSQAAIVLEVSPVSFTVPQPGGALTAAVVSNTLWNVQSSAGWATVQSYSGIGSENITLSCTPNIETTDRQATIIVKAGQLEREIVLFQPGVQLVVSPSQFEVAPVAVTISFDIQSNAYWYISNNATWLSTSAFNGTGNATVQVTCTSNPSADERENTLLVVGPNGLIRHVLVRQAGVELSASPASLQVSACGGEVNFELDSNYPWTLETTGINWLVASPASGSSGTFPIFVQCQPNGSEQPRQATVNIVAGQVVESVVISQPGAQLSVSPAVSSLPADGSSMAIAVTSNTCWQITGGAPWLSVSGASGEGNASLMISANLNCGSDRHATLTLTVAGAGGFSKTITISQAGAVLSVSPGTVQVGAAGGSASFSVNANLAWTLSEGAAWLTTVTSGTVVSLFCDANGSTASRQAIVTVQTACDVQQIIVMQAGSGPALFLATQPDTLQFPAEKDTQYIFLASNVTWTVVDKPAWVSVSPASGFGFDTLRVICQVNPHGLRFDTIEIQGAGLSQWVHVIQKKKPADPPNNPGDTIASVGPELLTVPSGGDSEAALEEIQVPVLRLAAVDFDYRLSVAPNPVRREATVRFELPEAQWARVELVSAQGRLAAVLAEGDFEKGRQEVSFFASGYPADLYWVRLVLAGRVLAAKAVLMP